MNISIILVALNEEKYIGRAIRSCLNQSFQKGDYEIIIVDNGSTDKTPQILETFTSSLHFLKVIRLPQNMGIAYASNVGINESQGQFIVRVDADDYINEKLLEIEYMFLSMNKEYDAVSCDYLEVDDHENVLKRCDGEKEPIACGVMFRKDRLIDVGMYASEFKICEDKDLRLRFLKKFNIHRIELPLYRYRQHSQNSHLTLKTT